SGSQGIPRRFSERRILQIACTRVLHSLGVVPSRAAAAALYWTDQGAPGLAPAEVYGDGNTYLLLDETGARIVKSAADATLTQLLATGAGWQPGAAVIVDLRRLRDRVLERLAEPIARTALVDRLERELPPFLQRETK